MITSDQDNRILELDGLRAAAILLVIAWHYIGIPGGLDSAPWAMFIVGRTGVDLFFVLSGYLIAGILLRNARASNYFSAFYLRRAFRILPPYFGMVAIYLLGRQVGVRAAGLFDGPLPWWSYVLGVQNVWMAIEQTYGARWLAATWSLAIEEQFYLLFPLLVYLAAPRMLMRVLVVLLVACPIGRAVLASQGDDFAYSVLMPMRADILAIGALIAWLEFYRATTDAVRLTFRALFWLTVSLFPFFAWGGYQTSFHMATWGYSYLVALYGSILFVVIDQRGSPRLAIFRSRVATFLARISYALYLVHGPVLVLVFAFVHSAPTHGVKGSAMLIASAFVISVLICWASYRLIEGPLIKTAHRKFVYVVPLNDPPAGQDVRLGHPAA